MRKSYWRLVIVAILLIILFLPDHREVGSYWIFIQWASMELKYHLLNKGFSDYMFYLGALLYLWIVPVLILFNVFLSVLSSHILITIYRCALLISIPLTWVGTFIVNYPGVATWMIAIAIPFLAAVEVLEWKESRPAGVPDS